MPTEPPNRAALLGQYLRAAGLIERGLASTARPHGLNATQLLILAIADGSIERPPGDDGGRRPVTASQIAEITGYSLSRIGAQMEGLYAQGLIELVESPGDIQDGRARCYGLTRRGSIKATKIRPGIEILEVAFRWKAHPELRGRRARALDRLVDYLEQEIQRIEFMSKVSDTSKRVR